MPYKEKHISVLPTVPATLPLPLSTTNSAPPPHHGDNGAHTQSSTTNATNTDNNTTTTTTVTSTTSGSGATKSEETSYASRLTIVHPATLPVRTDIGGGASPLSDDAVQINAKIMQGVEYPSVRAALIARDALHAARKYYDLFYTKGKVRHPGATTTTTTAHANLPTTASSTTLTSTPLVQTPLHVLNTPYHTFFPPVLTHEDRARIIATILGHAPSPFSRWRWHQAEDYCHLHARNVHHNSVYHEPIVPPHHIISPTGVPATVALGYDVHNINSNNNNTSGSGGTLGTHAAALRRMSSPRDTTLPLRSSSALLGLRHASCDTLTPSPTAAAATATTAATGRLSGSGSNVDTTTNVQGHSTPNVTRLTAEPRQSVTSTELRGATGGNASPVIITTTTTAAEEAVVLSSTGATIHNNSNGIDTPPPPAIAAINGAAGAFPIASNTGAANVSTGTHSCPHSSTGPTPVVGLKDAGIFTFPTSQQGPEYFHETAEDGTKTLIIIMVGLPARGKTFLAQKICRLLSWHGSRAKVHNLQVMWRRLLYEEATRRWRESGARRSNESRHSHSDTSHTSTSVQDASPGKPSHFLRTEHFRQLINDPASEARRLYRRVLQDVAQDCRRFFAHGGEVVVMNDDFVTHELRNEAADLLRPLASQLFFMEVCRESEHNAEFNECKVKDPSEYPPGDIDAEKAKEDFSARLAFLESVYESFSDPSHKNNQKHQHKSRDSHGQGERETSWCSDNAGRHATATTSVSHARVSQGYIQVRHPNIVEAHGISGYAASRIISYVMNLSQSKMQHPIYFLRHGESCYNLERRIGGDPLLTEQGMRDAAALLEFLYSLKTHLREQDRGRHTNSNASAHACKEGSTGGGGKAEACEEEDCGKGVQHVGNGRTQANEKEEEEKKSMSVEDSVLTVSGQDEGNADKLEIWTSQLRRAIQTAELSERLLNIRTLRWSSLNEIHAGVCEGMTYDEVTETYPLIDHFRKMSKYTFRYPDGESYQDLVVRLEPVIMELENADKVVVVVAHQAVLRCLLAYFGSTSAESSVRVKVPHRTVWRCSYDSKGIASLEEVRLDNYEVGFSIHAQAATTDDLDAVAAAVPTADDPTVDVI